MMMKSRGARGHPCFIDFESSTVGVTRPLMLVRPHACSGADERVGHEVLEFWGAANAPECAEDAAPTCGVVCLGDVVEGGIACSGGGVIGGGFGFAEALENGFDSIVYVESHQKCCLGGVKDGMVSECFAEAVS